ncbi:MAG: T9SS type A sorting domain-containing protein [Bacteroidetes bacterium]|nr:T9SS type A sorting domain-containing protein [Bacteroidota bacterium]
MRSASLLLLVFLGLLLSARPAEAQIIIDHTCTDLSKVPDEHVLAAKQQFRLAYGHTSHGSQIVSGMSLLRAQSGSIYTYSTSGDGGALSLHDRTPSGDLGHNGDLAWERATRALLDRADNDRNMVMWSWCGGCSDNTVEGIQTYLDAMDALERDYPEVRFVYMTGHLDGSGIEGTLHQRNEQIRQFCRTHGKVLFDFADIESYDPDGNYFLDRHANDNCDYIGSDGQRHNWAQEWCARNPGQCGDCSCAHSQCLNCQQKGKAFWWMMARLAGWTGPGGTTAGDRRPSASASRLDVYPSPASAQVTIALVQSSTPGGTLLVSDVTGRIVAQRRLDGAQPRMTLSTAALPVGLYMARLLGPGGITAARFVVVR